MAHHVLYAEVNSYAIAASSNAFGISTKIMKANDPWNIMGL